MIEKLLRNYYIKNTIVIGMALLLLFSSAIGTYINYNKSKNNLYSNIDKTLKNTALNANLSLTDSFHNRAIGKDDIDVSENYKNIISLSRFANEINNIEYIYTMTKQGNKIYFTSSSATQEEIDNDEAPAYFDYYDEATDVLKNVLNNNKTVYEESTDKWGTFRTVFIPLKTKDGTKYILGADVKIDFINLTLDKYLKNTILEFLLIITILLVLGFYFWKISRKELKEIKRLQDGLEKEIQHRTKDLNIAKKEIESSHKHTRESIEYASLIQNALRLDSKSVSKNNFFIFSSFTCNANYLDNKSSFINCT